MRRDAAWGVGLSNLACRANPLLPVALLSRGIAVLNAAAEVRPAVMPARYVLLPLAERLTGYTVKAMVRKIQRGDWPEGKVWRRAPDGRILLDLVGYHKWVEHA